MASVGFELNRCGTVVKVSDYWDTFARQNGGTVFKKEFLDTQYVNNFSDEGIRLMISSILDEIWRAPEKNFSYPYCCDSPDMRRDYLMVAFLLKPNRIRFENILLFEEMLAKPDKARERPKAFLICPKCKKIKTPGSWIDIRNALCEYEILKDANNFSLSPNTCETCID